ncbi:MAG TPA: glycosyltransferase, partial [Cytophagaceae bacterium]|nr:glycosyltransferase [Cytophagaceae bacterium]
MTDKKLIVFHVPKWYPNRYDSLLGVFVKRHVLSTMPATLPVVICVMASQSSDQWYEIDRSIEEGILTYRCYYKKNITGISALDKFIKLLLYFGLVLKLYKRAKQEVGKPCVVHAHILLRTAVAARVIKWFDHVPYILLEHSSQFIRKEVKAFSPVAILLARHVVKRADEIITVSECLARGMRDEYKLFNKNYRVIYNCVDTQIFSEKERSSARAVKSFLYVAEFDNASKNITGLLQSIAILYARRKDFQVNMIGYGKDEQMLRELADQLQINEKVVFFRGKFSAKKVAASIQDSDALLMFSNFETLSCIITESLCCGTPVVSTAVGGIVEIVNSSNGLLVDKANEEAMALTMEKIIDGNISFDKHQIAENAHALFSNQA